MAGYFREIDKGQGRMCTPRAGYFSERCSKEISGDGRIFREEKEQGIPRMKRRNGEDLTLD